MYITSDLFGSTADSASSHQSNPCHTQPWNKMTVDTGLGKRKRSKEEATQTEYGGSSGFLDGARADLPSWLRSADQQPSPGKMLRVHSFPQGSVNNARPWRLPGGTTTATITTAPHRPFKQLKRVSPKKPPPPLTKSTSHLMDTDEPAASHPCPASSEPPPSSSDLRSCHICHTAPKRKSDLENFLECQSCEGRACYICARECAGGCQRQLCRKCCVEVGEEGNTWCLHCYQRIGIKS
ncbi:hypothetical protein BDV96DRAFT_585782 [Lophiotrema nucula]|uniref:Uncharacterized protein n=1 Tax=Lophiotrema nucula TaxID=690887 RepID=A0A6A5YQY6_9PLEO|nr:hypothetical protein BDV96DRAFT_585782 [Lophiotrema nucula]